jgi:hypothetical protein
MVNSQNNTKRIPIENVADECCWEFISVIMFQLQQIHFSWRWIITLPDFNFIDSKLKKDEINSTITTASTERNINGLFLKAF